jgi:diadenosine tetraphosphate (Ap4A) HIT family hydrolase
MSIENCALCGAVGNKRVFIGGVDVNTMLGRTERFVITPALGPLVAGHVLVVSAEHKAGLRYLPVSDQQDYEQLRLQLRTYCMQFGDNLLEAEHGARDKSLRGPCIRHTHVHIFPGLEEASRLFDNSFASLCIEERSLGVVDSYIRIDDGSRATLYDGSQVIGQEIRRTIGRYLRVDDWDWAVSPKPELIARTIKYWSGIGRWLD